MMGLLECSDGTQLYVLPVGTRIRDTKQHGLTGRIKGYEYHESGKISPLPYAIEWDDSSAACDARGWLFVYGCNDTVERIPE